MNKLNITNDPHQIINLIINDLNLELHLKFNPMGAWFIDLKFGNKQVNGVRLACGTLHLSNNNLPFDILIHSQGIDPATLDAFSSGYAEFFVLEKSEVETIKGAEIKV